MKTLLLLLAGFSVVNAANVPASTPAGIRDGQYRLQPTDRLELSFRYSPEYNQPLVIQPDGFVGINLVGSVKLEGLTVDEARTVVLEKLKERLNDPEITLTLEEYVRPGFVVAGQVVSPGHYDLHGKVTAVEAIAMAGGFKDTSKTSKVILFRHVNADLAETKILDLKKITNPSHPHLEESVNLQSGDLLVVPQNNVSRIERFIHWANVGVFANPVP